MSGSWKVLSTGFPVLNVEYRTLDCPFFSNSRRVWLRPGLKVTPDLEWLLAASLHTTKRVVFTLLFLLCWHCKRVAKQNQSILLAQVAKSGLHDI